MDRFILFFEIIGTVAFAFSGAVTAIKKEMDIFGVFILGVTTAVGGGIMRDILLGQIPPQVFLKPMFVIVAAIVVLAVFGLSYIQRGSLTRKELERADYIMVYADALGLAVFTVVGVELSFAVPEEPNLFLSAFVGVITGVGGGVLRDIMAGQKPYIFVKHIYALSSVAGALVSTFLWNHASDQVSMLAGIVTIFVLRCLAVHFRWNLPKISIRED